MAVVPDGAAFSSLGSLLMLLTVVPIGLMFAPQPVRRDRRVVVAVVLLVLVLLTAKPTWAAVTKICDWCPWCIDCWFI